MKRYRPRAQGRATIIRRRTCHITLQIMENKEEETLGTES
jgi:ribosomal protein L22